MQRSVTLSSAESEFFGCMKVACSRSKMLKDTLWIRQVQLDLDLLQPGPSINDVLRFQIGLRHGVRPTVVFKKVTKHILRAAEFLK